MTNAEWINKDFYQVLGVSQDASADEIKKAYRKLARTNHPDSNPGDSAAEERFKAIAEAYDVVGDPDKRKQYDEMRRLGAAGMFGGGYGGPGGPGGATPFDLGDLFAGQAGGLGDLFGGIFTGGGPRARRTRQPRRGADVETEVTVGFSDAVGGSTVTLRLTSDAPCPDCSGTGARAGTVPHVCAVCDGSGMTVAAGGGAFAMTETCRGCGGRGLVVDDPCPTCHGSGRGMSSRSVSARIPAGVRDGQRIRLRGQGASGEFGGPAGDLLVTVHVRPHPLFGRRGDALTLTVPVTFPEAALGAEIKVPTLGGPPVTLKLPPGTPNGRTFRVRGKGVPRKDGTRGDLLVTVEVSVPRTLTDEARSAVEAFRTATTDADVRSGLLNGGVS